MPNTAGPAAGLSPEATPAGDQPPDHALSGSMAQRVVGALAESRRRYQDLVAISRDFVWETDAAGRFVFVNPEGALGYTAQQLIGRLAQQLVIEDADDQLPSPFLARLGVDGAEMWLRDASETPACVVAAALPLYGDDGVWCGARGLCRDVTAERQRNKEVARFQERERLLAYIQRSIAEEIDPGRLLEGAAEAIGRALATNGCAIHRPNPETDGGLYRAASYGAEDLELDPPAERDATRPVEWEAAGGQALGIATRFRQATNGALTVWRRADAPAWSREERSLLGNVARQIGIALEQVASQEALDRMARFDDMTGLMNRRAFLDALRERLAHAQRTGRSGVLLYVDLDNFKAVNDSHGHDAGDDAIRAAADLLKDNSRALDLAARLGGDEFALWLEETDGEGADAKAEALREGALTRLRPHSGSPDKPLGLSVGGALHEPSIAESADALMGRADGAMYEVKRDGKDGYRLHRAARKGEAG